MQHQSWRSAHRAPAGTTSSEQLAGAAASSPRAIRVGRWAWSVAMGGRGSRGGRHSRGGRVVRHSRGAQRNTPGSGGSMPAMHQAGKQSR